MSTYIDDDTARTINSGRETLGAMLASAQTHLQKLFVVFVVGLIGTIVLLYYWGWDVLKRDLLVRAEGADVFAITPFDVILLQAKIGMAVGVLLSLPLVVYYARDPLRERGLWPAERIPRWKLAVLVGLAAVLSTVGIAYGYFLFFPIMFDFLAQSAIDSSFAPDYGIVQWAEFVLFLLLSFALAAQLPLFMSALSYAGIVRYRSWREKWKYALMAILGFGAVFSPPDPFTQVMWAVPLFALYGFSLYLTKFLVLLKFSSERIGIAAIAGRNWNRILAGGFLVGALTYLLLSPALGPTLEGLVGAIDPALSVPDPAVLGLSRSASALAWGGLLGAAAAAVVLDYYVLAAAEEAALQRGFVVGDPTAIDLAELDAAGIRAAPPEAFAALTEPEAVDLAGTALEAGDREAARAILDRWDAAHPDATVDAGADGEGDGSGAPTGRSTASPAGTWARRPENVLAVLATGAERVDWGRRLRALWNVLLGVVVLAAGTAYVAVAAPYGPGLALPPVLTGLGLTPTAIAVAVGLAAGLVLAGLLLAVVAGYAAYAAATDPSAVDLWTLSPEEVRTAPAATFGALTEPEATAAADAAMAHDADGTARAILDRYDDVQRRREREREAAQEGTVVTETAAGVASSFTEEETTEEEVGGYLYDLQFVVSSLASKSFRLVGLFMLVTGGGFLWLYGGVGSSGIGLIMRDFLSRLPETVRPEEVVLVTLHPVEHLIFIVKISTLLGVVATLPLLLYYAWPALAERGLVSGDRGAVFRWSTVAVIALTAGSLAGYAFVAPSVISWLANDAIQSSMIVKYRINAFGWLVFFTTVGIGILACVPAVMFVLHRGGIVVYPRMHARWREVTVGIVAVGAVFSPRGLFTMVLLSLPLVTMYYVGIGLLWVYTLGGRRTPARQQRGGRAD